MRFGWHWAALMAAACYICSTSPSSGEEISLEAKVKAACLFNFAKFIQWPPATFPDPSSPFRLCIVGVDPFGTLLEALQSKEVQGRKIALGKLGVSDLGKMKECHILYLSQLQPKQEEAILSGLSTFPVLTVSDAPLGAIIRFFLEEEKVRFEIYLQKSRDLDIKISAQLLRLAVVK